MTFYASRSPELKTIATKVGLALIKNCEFVLSVQTAAHTLCINCRHAVEYAIQNPEMQGIYYAIKNQSYSNNYHSEGLHFLSRR